MAQIEEVIALLVDIKGEIASVRGGIASLNSRVETVVVTGETHTTELRELRAYVESLDEEARKTMEGMMDPSKMMEQFMGGGK